MLRTLWSTLWPAAMLLPSITSAQPVPVLPVTVQQRAAPPELVARVASAVGPDAQSVTTPLLTERFGRLAPQDDPLRSQRQEASDAIDAYFQHATHARRRLAPAVQALEQSRDALELREENRAVYLHALLNLGRIEFEDRHVAAADEWFRRAIDFDPAWTPVQVDCPPAVAQHYQQLRGAGASGAPGGVVVHTPREGCSVTVDGHTVPGTARDREVTVPAGAHRVAASCEQPSRIRTVRVTAGAHVDVTIDPRLDAALQFTAAPFLSYPSASDATSHLASDAATVGATLGARRVVVVDADSVRVIDVTSQITSVTIPVGAPDLDARVRAALSGAAPSTAMRADGAHDNAPVTIATRGPGAGPWVLTGVGAAATVVGVVLLVLRNGEYDQATAACPADARSGARQCGGLQGQARTDAQSHYEAAGVYDAAGWVTLGVGGAAVAGGLLWYLLAPRAAPNAPTLHGALLPGGATLQAGWRF